MRQLLVIVFGLCLAAPGIGTWGWLHVQKKMTRKAVKRQIIAGMDRKDLTLLTFHAEDTTRLLHWHHAGEFEYNDAMYDIVEREVTGDSIRYWCFWDQQESLINDHLTQLITKHTDTEDRQATQRLMDFCKTLWTGEASTGRQIINTHSRPRNLSAFLMQQCTHSPPVPPPDVV